MSYTSSRPDEPEDEPFWMRWLAAVVRFVVDNLWPLIAGAIVGLALGLFLAWIVWPVKYEGTVAITDLDTQTQAYYIAAVAESYVYYGTAQALDVAEQRLTPFGDDLEQALDQSIEYYGQSGDPNAAIYQSNIRQLEADLVADQFLAAPPAAEMEAAAAPEAVADADSADAGGRSWTWWLVIGLGTVLFVVSAVFLVRWWRSRSQPGAVPAWQPDARDEDVVDGTVVGATPANADAYSQPAVAPRSPAREFVDTEGYGFSAEPDEAHARSQPARAVEEGGFEEEEWDDEPPDAPALSAPGAPPAVVVPPAAAATVTAQAPTELGKFTAHYRVGMREYEESQNIRAVNGPYIGEYGMGVNMKNGILQNNPDQVMALDVWLFDKVDPTKLLSQTRVLLAEYVFDNGLEDAFPRENPDDLEPIIAEAGQRFQLRGNKLLLDCEVVEARCAEAGSSKGIFESVQVSLTVFLVP